LIPLSAPLLQARRTFCKLVDNLSYTFSHRTSHFLPFFYRPAYNNYYMAYLSAVQVLPSFFHEHLPKAVPC
jgi:hypothetical protein